MNQEAQWIAWLACVGWLSVTQRAHAEEPGTETAETRAPLTTSASVAWRIGISINAIATQNANFDVEPIGSGERLPGSLKRTDYGPSGGPVILEAGYVLSRSLVLGMMLDFGSGLNVITIEGIGETGFKIEQSGASFAVGPQVTYLFLPEHRLRPFVDVAFGYTKNPSKQLDQELRLTIYQGIGGAGVSYFLTPGFSLDTSIRAGYGIGSGYVDSGILKNASVSGSVYSVLWMFGTSGWL